MGRILATLFSHYKFSLFIQTHITYLMPVRVCSPSTQRYLVGAPPQVLGGSGGTERGVCCRLPPGPIFWAGPLATHPIR